MKRAPATYWEYIRLDQLLSLQDGVERDGDVALVDEMHFIVIHQTIELMFKLLLKELRGARDVLGASFVPEEVLPEVSRHLGRAAEAMRVTTAQFKFMEMLQPLDFLSFRDKLGTSSGAQSFQMRELEHLLGLPHGERREVLRRLRDSLANPSMADHFERFILDPLGAIQDQLVDQIASKTKEGHDTTADVWTAAKIDGAMKDIEIKGTLRASLEKWLFRTPICDSSPPRPGDDDFHDAFAMDQKVVRAFAMDYIRRGELTGWDESQVQSVKDFLSGADEPPQDWETERIRLALLFIQMYPDLPLLAWPRMLIERVIELEEAIVNFRNAHARTAERVIGSRPGTGGSPGIKYLDLTRDMRIFPELIQIRGILIPKDRRWRFPGMEEFGFKQS